MCLLICTDMYTMQCVSLRHPRFFYIHIWSNQLYCLLYLWGSVKVQCWQRFCLIFSLNYFLMHSCIRLCIVRVYKCVCGVVFTWYRWPPGWCWLRCRGPGWFRWPSPPHAVSQRMLHGSPSPAGTHMRPCQCYPCAHTRTQQNTQIWCNQNVRTAKWILERCKPLTRELNIND